MKKNKPNTIMTGSSQIIYFICQQLISTHKTKQKKTKQSLKSHFMKVIALRLKLRNNKRKERKKQFSNTKLMQINHRLQMSGRLKT